MKKFRFPLTKLLLTLVLFGTAVLLCACSGSGEDTFDGDLGDTVMVQIEMENGGIMKLELYPDAAPITVENFLSLVNEGFYDGLIFHRVIEDFMIQGGDPEGTGRGGSKDRIKGEFSSNGVNNPISHVKGVISMARAQDPNSASSQFFITVADATYLDGSYAAFGTVTDGMDVAEKIAADARPTDNNGTIPREQQPVIESIVITD